MHVRFFARYAWIELASEATGGKQEARHHHQLDSGSRGASSEREQVLSQTDCSFETAADITWIVAQQRHGQTQTGGFRSSA